jgi:hypothetical protein
MKSSSVLRAAIDWEMVVDLLSKLATGGNEYGLVNRK